MVDIGYPIDDYGDVFTLSREVIKEKGICIFSNERENRIAVYSTFNEPDCMWYRNRELDISIKFRYDYASDWFTLKFFSWGYSSDKRYYQSPIRLDIRGKYSGELEVNRETSDENVRINSNFISTIEEGLITYYEKDWSGSFLYDFNEIFLIDRVNPPDPVMVNCDWRLKGCCYFDDDKTLFSEEDLDSFNYEELLSHLLLDSDSPLNLDALITCYTTLKDIYYLTLRIDSNFHC